MTRQWNPGNLENLIWKEEERGGKEKDIVVDPGKQMARLTLVNPNKSARLNLRNPTVIRLNSLTKTQHSFGRSKSNNDW